MSDTLLTIDGLAIDSAPVFLNDCVFPITDFANCCQRDDVLDNLPIRIGHWAKDTKAPAISKRTVKVKTPAASADDCFPALPKITMELESCELKAPNQVDIGAQTGDLNYRDLVDDFCYRRKVLPQQICLFDQNGNLAPGDMVSQAFLLEAMQVVFETIASEVGRVALVGDSAVANPIFQPNEFDGFYTQLIGGWDPSTGTPCPDVYNKAVEIDWAVLTGNANAGPDTVTIAGQTVTIGAKTYNVPVGLNLANFLDQIWIDKVEQMLNCVGGVTSWEMHASLGFRACFLRANACMQPCSSNACIERTDPRVLALYQASITSKFATLLTGRSFPVLESQYVKDNELWFGPRAVGGRPTYGLFFDSMDRFFGRNPVISNGNTGYGNPGVNASPNSLMTMDAATLAARIEDIAAYWTMERTYKGTCVSGMMLMRAGMLSCSRNAWLHVKNIQCPNWIEACDTQIEVVP